MASRAAYGCALPSRCSQVQCGIAVEPRETRAGSRLALKFVRKASDGALGLGHITRSQRHPVSGHGKVFSVISEIGKTRIANSMRQECLLKETKQQQSESLSLMTTSTSSLRHATPCFQTTTDLQVRLLKRHLSVGRQVLLAASTAITTGSFSPSFTSAALTAVTNPSAVLAVSDTAEQLQSAGGDDITTSAAVASAISAGVAGSGLDPVSNGVVSVVFAVAVLGLVVVTGGVVYLSLSDWLEKRNLDKLVAEEQELARKQQAKAEAGQKKVPVVRATPKGFGRRSSKEEEEEAEK